MGSGRKKKREGLVEGPKQPKGEEEKGREHDCDVFGGRKGMKEGGMQQREEKEEEEEQIRGLVWLEKGKNGRSPEEGKNGWRTLLLLLLDCFQGKKSDSPKVSHLERRMPSARRETQLETRDTSPGSDSLSLSASTERQQASSFDHRHSLWRKCKRVLCTFARGRPMK